MEIKNEYCEAIGRDEASEAESESSVRRNVTAVLGFEFIWGIGNGFVPLATVVAGYLHFLGATKTVIGLLPALATMILIFAPTLSLRLIPPVEGRIRKVLLVYGLCPLGYIFLGLLTLRLPSGASGLRILACFVLYAFFFFFVDIGDPHYSSMIVEITPRNQRGRFFGLKLVLTGCGGILGGAVCAVVLRSIGPPQDYALCFLFAGMFIFSSVIWFSRFRETRLPNMVKQPALSELVSSAWTVVRNNRPFVSFLVWQTLFIVAQGVYPFLGVAIQERLRASEVVVGQLTMAFTISSLVMPMLFGWVGDHFGHRRSIQLMLLFFLAGLVVTASASNLPVAWIGFFLTSSWVMGAAMVSFNYALDLLPATAPAKVWAAITCTGASVRTVAYIGVGVALDHWRYGPVFFVCGLFALASLVVAFSILKEPRGAHEG